MKAIILAAGRGTRMKQLTDELPKPMLTYKGKNLIEHKIDILEDIKEIDEVILIIGYLGEKIKEYFGNKYRGKKISYIQMDELTGTGSAIWLCKDLLEDGEKFLVMMGDDIYSKEDVLKLIFETRKESQNSWAMLVSHEKNPIGWGDILKDENDRFIGINMNKESGLTEGLINAGMYILDTNFFNYELVKLETREEWGIPQTMAVTTKDISTKIIEAKEWKQITKEEDLI